MQITDTDNMLHEIRLLRESVQANTSEQAALRVQMTQVLRDMDAAKDHASRLAVVESLLQRLTDELELATAERATQTRWIIGLVAGVIASIVLHFWK